MVLVKGIIETSFIDYPKLVSLVIFTSGCNFRCHYCHNPELVKQEEPFMSEEKLLTTIEEKKDWIDGVVITGGEPTLHEDLPKLIKKIKDFGLLVKLDTNGSNPKMLKELIDKKFIDYIAMDIKAPLDDYKKVIQNDYNAKDILESIELIKSSGIDYEFRTTILPNLINEKDILKIGYLLEGSELLVLQNFRNEKTLDKDFEEKEGYLQPQMEHFTRILKPFVKKVISR